jgi:hypothetical protein
MVFDPNGYTNGYTDCRVIAGAFLARPGATAVPTSPSEVSISLLDDRRLRSRTVLKRRCAYASVLRQTSAKSSIGSDRTAAAIRRFAGVTEEPKPRELHHTFNGAQVFLGGLRRSFAVSPRHNYLSAWSPKEKRPALFGMNPKARALFSRKF